MTEEELYQKLIAQSISFVSIRPRSEKEILSFLQKKIQRLHVVNQELHAKIMRRLQELGYIDDASFVRTYVENMTRNHPMGKRMFVQKLRQKGVDKDMIDAVLSDQGDEGNDEEQDARNAVKRKVHIWRKLPDMEAKSKAYGFLARRGFSGSVVRKIIDEVLGKDYNTPIEE